jgi:hypothetical protein
VNAHLRVRLSAVGDSDAALVDVSNPDLRIERTVAISAGANSAVVIARELTWLAAQRPKVLAGQFVEVEARYYLESPFEDGVAWETAEVTVLVDYQPAKEPLRRLLKRLCAKVAIQIEARATQMDTLNPSRP